MRERLEDVIRPGEVAEDLVLLLRGGVHTDGIDRLRDQAGEMNRRFSLEGGDCYGISVFGVTEESESWILARNMAVRRRLAAGTRSMTRPIAVSSPSAAATTVSATKMSPSCGSCQPSALHIGLSCSTDTTGRTTGSSWTPWVT